MRTAAIASSALAIFSTHATGAELEEVIVTGVRAAQEAAIVVKREASQIVDSISAEDIGRLPDVTISDSLQRVPGVQIRCSAGEVQRRGCGEVPDRRESGGRHLRHDLTQDAPAVRLAQGSHDNGIRGRKLRLLPTGSPPSWRTARRIASASAPTLHFNSRRPIRCERPPPRDRPSSWAASAALYRSLSVTSLHHQQGIEIDVLAGEAIGRLARVIFQ